ncbi:hypothetical protein N4T20_16595 [Flavobacterium sp. TR2]|uniref:hypothetical protein n=1 Tax=Flavobacterium sp. TR2 TaxID=2977321 RepID=UPI0021B09B93|nr:hypothetical protein [Flavobacterium sp. TR2]UWY27336.1 hypothetical protein N4T20_16595 [Flavobacterium sp. TR2]
MKRFLPFLLLFFSHLASAQSFMYLNAVDFDFTTNKAGYTGHFNIYSPPIDSSKWGYNAGVMKINYSTSDSIMLYTDEYVKLKPLDKLVVGSKYEARYNEHKIKNKNSSYSIYMQALYALRNPSGNATKIFAHAHGELLISNFEISEAINTLQRDTLTITSLDSIPKILSSQNNKNNTKIKSITGYFGLGVTFDLKCTERSRLFFQPTIGYTTNYPQPSSVNTDGNAASYYLSEIKEWNPFYLVRSYFRYILSTRGGAGADGAKAATSELILGTDIRGLFPKFAPYYSVYIGLNLDLAKLVDLFKE